MDDRCDQCMFWRRTGDNKAVNAIGHCSQWAPHDYWPKRGRGSSRFIPMSGGVFCRASDYCAKFKRKGSTA